MLILWSAVGAPLLARLLTPYGPAVALIAPSLILVGLVSMLCPHRIIPPAALVAIYAADLLTPAREAIAPSVVGRVLDGQWTLLWIPAAALAVGYLLVYSRRRWHRRLMSPSFPTNLHILARRPLLFARKYWLSLAAVTLAAALDMITTIRMMNAYGPEIEMHAPMRIMAEVFGVDLGVVLGTLGRLAFVVLVAAIWRPACRAVMLLCAVLYTLAAMSNHFGWL